MKRPTKAQIESENDILKEEVKSLGSTILKMEKKARDLEGRIQTLGSDLERSKEITLALEHQLDAEKQARSGLYGFGVVVLIIVATALVFV